MPQRIDNQRLFYVLGVSQSATPEEIKRAYHRVALETHPDKVGPNNAAASERFKQAKEAFTVLGHPKKRRVYIRYGERGVEYLNNPMTSPLATNFGMATLLLVFALVALGNLVVFILFSAFVAAKVDELAHWSWPSVFSPLFVEDAIVVVVGAIFLVIVIKNKFEDRGIETTSSDHPTHHPNHNNSSRNSAGGGLASAEGESGSFDVDEGHHEQQHASIAMMVSYVLLPFAVLGLVIFTIALPIKLERDEPRSKMGWFWTFLPFFFSAAVGLGYGAIWQPLRFRELMEEQGRRRGDVVRMTTCTFYVMVTNINISVATPLVQSGLVFCKVIGLFGDLSWFVVLLPLMVAMVSNVVDSWSWALHRKKENDSVDGAGGGSGNTLLVSMCQIGQVLLIVALLLASLVMCAMKANKPDSISLGVALIPMWIVVGGTFVFALFGSCMLCGHMNEEAEMEKVLDEISRETQVEQEQQAQRAPPVRAESTTDLPTDGESGSRRVGAGTTPPPPLPVPREVDVEEVAVTVNGID